jgi:hypothetical protein
MRSSIISRRARSVALAAAACLLPLSSACYRWTPAAAAPLATVRDDRPSQLRLHRTDGSTVTLRAPRLVTDSTRALGTSGAESGASDTLVAGELLGRTLATGESARGGGSRNATVLVRASEIRSAEVRTLSGWRTALFVALVAGGIAGSLVAYGS